MRQRPCGQMPVPTATARSSWSSAPALLDVQLDERRRPGAAPRRRGPACAGSRPARVSASAMLTPSPSASARARSGASAPVISRDPAQATPNRAPSSSPNTATPSGRAGTNPPRAQGVDGGERGDDAERPVEGAAVGHGVQVRAEDDTRAASVRWRSVGIAPPGPEVAGPVVDEVEPPGGRLAGEPLPQVGVLARPGEAPVAAGARMPPDPGEVGPHPVEGRPLPRREATFLASQRHEGGHPGWAAGGRARGARARVEPAYSAIGTRRPPASAACSASG